MIKRVMIVSPVVPYPSLSGNSVRVAQLIQIFRDLGAEVHFVLCPIAAISDRRVGDEMYSEFGSFYTELNSGDISTGRWWQALLDFAKKRLKLKKITWFFDFMFADGFITSRMQKDFQSLVNRVRPDAVICEYVLLSKLVEGLDSETLTLVDTHDRFAERNTRIRQEDGQGLWWSLSRQQERHLLSRFDRVIAIQENEEKMFMKDLADSAGKVMTLDIIAPALRQTYIQPDSPVIGFIGSQNMHNRQGLSVFLQCHWANIKHLVPNTILHVAGAIFEDIQAENFDNVIFLGRVDDLSEFYDQCSIIINPCLTGTGLKIKSVEALAHGKPLVSTPEGAEGLSFILDKGVYVSDLKAIEFATTCVNLLTTKTKRQNMGEQAITLINLRYNESRKAIIHLLGESSVAVS